MLPITGQTIDSFIDARDGQQYTTVTYVISPTERIINDADEYETHSKKKDVVYQTILRDSALTSITWMAQNLNFSTPTSKCYNDSAESCELFGRRYTWVAAKEVCPAGWHLPVDDEWYLLASLYGGVAVAGEHLKSAKLGGTNKSQFGVQKPGIYWSASDLNSNSAWDWKLNFRWKKLQRWTGGKHAFNLVRCVKDY